MTSFLNLEDDDAGSGGQPDTKIGTTIGAGLKSKPKEARARADTQAVAKAGEAHGFTRSTDPAPQTAPQSEPKSAAARRGRPPLNEDMTYWRIYLSRSLRDELNQLRDQEGRRLNDVLEDMLAAYKKTR